MKATRLAVSKIAARVRGWRLEHEAENRKLRRLLWMRHGCPLEAAYGDDGEMQCRACRVDFKREPAADIGAKWETQGRDVLAKARQLGMTDARAEPDPSSLAEQLNAHAKANRGGLRVGYGAGPSCDLCTDLYEALMRSLGVDV